MKLWEYISSKVVILCILGMAGISFGIIGVVADIGMYGILLFASVYMLIIAIWLFIDFWMEKKKLEKLERIVEELSEKYLLGEVLPVPTSPVEQRYYQIMKEISQSAVGITEQYRREKEEYCDYVESWIHEIKTPLTACSLILSNGGDSKKLKTELKRADNLTENILYYARMRSVEKDIQIKKFYISDIYGAAVKSQMEILMSAKIRVETEGDFAVYSDPKMLEFILKQLLINCAKYCPRCLIKIRADQGAITVEDNGIGIPSHELRRITDRGFTGTNGRRLGSSTGMGLYIVRKLCESLEIDMNVESVQGEYTKFILSFRNLTKL